MAEVKAILDSNIFVAYYLEEDSCHEDAKKIIENLDQAEIIVPYCVIQEVSTILTYKSGKINAKHFLNDLEESRNIIIINNDVTAEIEYFKRAKGKLSFTDLSLLYLSRKHKALLLTFDKELIHYSKNN